MKITALIGLISKLNHEHFNIPSNDNRQTIVKEILDARTCMLSIGTHNNGLTIFDKRLSPLRIINAGLLIQHLSVITRYGRLWKTVSIFERTTKRNL